MSYTYYWCLACDCTSVCVKAVSRQLSESILVNVFNASEFTNNPSSYRCTKHGVLKYHCMRDSTLTGEVSSECIHTLSQIVDICTKALAEDLFSTKYRAMQLRN